MSDELDTLRRKAASHTAEAHLLATLLDRDDPRGGSHAHTAYQVAREHVRATDYPENEHGSVAFTHDLEREMADYLRSRHHSLQAQAARRRHWNERTARGLDRFLEPGRYTLDQLADVDPAEVARERERQPERVGDRVS